MTTQSFRDLLAQQPFNPFRVVMSSGQVYEVRRPETALLTMTSIRVGTDIANDGIPGEFKICSLSQVTTIEPLGDTGLSSPLA